MTNDDDLAKANDAAVGSIRRVATRIVDVPKTKREDAFDAVRRNMEEGFRQNGRDPATDVTASEWLDAYMKALRALVHEIDVGGGRSGNT